MILSFADPETERVWLGQRSRKLPNTIQERARINLRMLNRSKRLDDLRNPPGNRLEVLKGERAGQYSIRVNDQWRICFRWGEGGASDVAIVDYH